MKYTHLLPDEPEEEDPVFAWESTDAAVRPGPSRPPVPASSKGEVLLLVTDGFDHDGVEFILGGAGYSVWVRKPDSVTLDRSLQRPPDFVIAELARKDTAVLAFVDCLSRELGPHAPTVLAVTHDADEALIDRALDLGVKDVLSRPIHPAILRVKVARNLRKRVAIDPRRFGDYAIKQVLGRGGMGTVYLAEREGHQLALKVLDVGPRGLEPEALARFRREADVLKRLSGPTIPRWFDAGRIGDSFYCAMEFIPGETLASLIDRRGPIGIPAVRRLLLEVATTLELLHRAGLVHRDVKPSNVIVTPDGSAKLVDFGLAKSIGDCSLTRDNEILGTAAYMAPEYVALGTMDQRTDAFALGMTAFEALLGRCPLSGSPLQIASLLRNGLVPKPSDILPPDVDRELVGILEGLLAVRPDARLPLSVVLELLEPYRVAARASA